MNFRFRSLLGATSAFLPLGSPVAAQPPTPPVVPTPIPTPVPAPTPTPDFPSAVWAPAAPGNFRHADRPTSRAIDRVIIHDIEGSAIGAVNWFRNPISRVSSHYVVSGDTGTVWQLVRERDVAYHAGNGDINARSVGIEHEGYAYRPGFYDTTLYEASARLVRQITDRYQIPRDRTHIIGHFEVPDATHPGQFGGGSHHTDPGPYWDWDSYMTLVRNDARFEAVTTVPTVLHPGETATVTLSAINLGDDPWAIKAASAASKMAASPIDADRIALTERVPVYLGIWPSPVLRNTPTPLQSANWTSPRLVGLPTGADDIAPTGTAQFSFTLQAPATADTASVSQQFRLIGVPPAPRPMVGFGPTLPVTVSIKPWDIVTAPSASGPDWHQNGAIFWSKAPATSAQWTAAFPIGGSWDVYVRWPGAKGRTGAATYEVTATDGAHSVLIDQRTKTWGWHRLGRYAFGNAGTKTPSAVIHLTGQSSGTLVADSVRFVGPFSPEKTSATK